VNPEELAHQLGLGRVSTPLAALARNTILLRPATGGGGTMIGGDP